MTKKPATSSEAIASASLVANPDAPILYFDGAPNFGYINGICNVTLESLIFTSGVNGIVTERVVVAHLRMGLTAANALRQSLEGALLLAQPASGTTN